MFPRQVRAVNSTSTVLAERENFSRLRWKLWQAKPDHEAPLTRHKAMSDSLS